MSTNKVEMTINKQRKALISRESYRPANVYSVFSFGLSETQCNRQEYTHGYILWVYSCLVHFILPRYIVCIVYGYSLVGGISGLLHRPVGQRKLRGSGRHISALQLSDVEFTVVAEAVCQRGGGFSKTMCKIWSNLKKIF